VRLPQKLQNEKEKKKVVNGFLVMSSNTQTSGYGSSSVLEELQGGGTASWAGGSMLRSAAPSNSNIQATRSLPSVSGSLLRTSIANSRGSYTASAAAVAKTATVPAAGVLPLSGGPDLVERSAFLYGLLHSDHLVYDVHDAIATVTAAVAAGAMEGGDKVSNQDARRRGCGGINGGSVLSGVFYFPSHAPWPDMPWRPTYKSVVLLCVFVSAAACEQAIARVSDVATSAPGRTGVAALPLSCPSPCSSTSPAGVSSPRLVLRPASEYVLSPESVDTALLTFLTAPRLADVLLRRRRLRTSLERGATDTNGDRVEDMLAYVRANPPLPRLSSSAVRLYAAVLSPQSPFNVDWTAAQIAVNRGDGVVLPEMAVMEPWVGRGCGGLEDRSNVLREQDRRGGSETTAWSGKDGTGGDGARHSNPRSPWDTRTNSLPLTLQEEEYRKRYGAVLQGRLGSDGDRHDSGEGLAGLMPLRSSLYLGARQVFRGASWIFRRMREGLGEEEAPLLSSAGGSSGGAAAGLAAPLPPPPPAFSKNASPPSATAAFVGAAERRGQEPPRQRHRTEGGGGGGVESAREQLRGAPLVIPRYNAVGTALSWMPGFEHFGRLFVTSTTVLTPEGATTAIDTALPRGSRPPPPLQRRRRREEEEGGVDAEGSGAYENPAWESLVMRRYKDASAERVRTSHDPAQTAPPVRDSVVSWMSPARGTGWSTASSWPSREMLQPQEAPFVPLGGEAAAASPLPWRTASVAGPSLVRSKAQSNVGGWNSLTASTIAAGGPSARLQSENSALQFPWSTSAAVERVLADQASSTHSGVSKTDTPRRRGFIQVERVHATPKSAASPLDVSGDDNCSFLSHHRRRHGNATPDQGSTSVEDAPGGAAVDTTSQRASRGGRLSLAEGLRKFTRDAREKESEVPAVGMPLSASERNVGVAEAGGGSAPSGATDLSTRASRRTVSFTLPDEKS
jgi:hypothetical protein